MPKTFASVEKQLPLSDSGVPFADVAHRICIVSEPPHLLDMLSFSQQIKPNLNEFPPPPPPTSRISNCVRLYLNDALEILRDID